MVDDKIQNYKIRNALIGIILAFVVVIISISICVIVLNKGGEATIVNESFRDSSILSDVDLSRMKKEVYTLIRDVNNTDDNTIDMALRWDTLRQKDNDGVKQISVIADIDEYRQTYQILLDEYYVYMACPDLEITKYPESYCVGDDGDYDDSTTVVFGASLPYQGETSEGELFSISRYSWDRGDNRLGIQIQSCLKDNSVIERAEQAVDEHVTSLGASPSIFQKEFSVNCSHGE